MSPGSTLPDWLARAVSALQAGDVDGWMAIYAEDAVHEFPFARPGAPPRVEGRAAIAAYMHAVFENVWFGSLSEVRVREAGAETIVEATGHHLRLSDKTRRDLGFVWIVTRRDGLVVQYRDYMNPLQVADL